MLVKLDQIEVLSPNIKTFWFEREPQFDYTAGQFIEMTLPHDNPDERGIRHWFTLSSSPTEKHLSITTKFAERSSSFKQTLGALRPGQTVELSEPMGDFVLPKDSTIPLVFVAAGIGVTPFRSMTKWLIDSHEKHQIQVLMAATSIDDVVFEDLFKEYGIEPTLIISQPPEEWMGEVGHLSAERITSLIGGVNDNRIYVSGPEQMVEVFEKDFKAMGLNETQWVGDFFPGYPEV